VTADRHDYHAIRFFLPLRDGDSPQQIKAVGGGTSLTFNLDTADLDKDATTTYQYYLSASGGNIQSTDTTVFEVHGNDSMGEDPVTYTLNLIVPAPPLVKPLYPGNSSSNYDVKGYYGSNTEVPSAAMVNTDTGAGVPPAHTNPTINAGDTDDFEDLGVANPAPVISLTLNRGDYKKVKFSVAVANPVYELTYVRHNGYNPASLTPGDIVEKLGGNTRTIVVDNSGVVFTPGEIELTLKLSGADPDDPFDFTPVTYTVKITVPAPLDFLGPAKVYDYADSFNTDIATTSTAAGSILSVDTPTGKLFTDYRVVLNGTSFTKVDIVFPNAVLPITTGAALTFVGDDDNKLTPVTVGGPPNSTTFELDNNAAPITSSAINFPITTPSGYIGNFYLTDSDPATLDVWYLLTAEGS
jgi:hypothetical protein